MAANETAGSSPTLVQIGDSNSGLFVHTFLPDPDRFIRLFRFAVGRIPADVREIVTDYWKPVGPTSPTIILSNRAVLFTDNGEFAGIAMSDQSGKRLQFSGPAVVQVPDEEGQCLIAHELAHVHTDAGLALDTLHPTERSAYRAALGNATELIRLREEYADARLKVWGFDPVGLRQWCGQYLKQQGIQ